MSTPSGSTAAPGASDAAAKDDAIPQGDSSNMEVEDASVLRLLRAGRENTSGDSSATGGAPPGGASADASDQTTLDEAAPTAEPKVVWPRHRSNSAGSSATTELSVRFGAEHQQWYQRFAPTRSVQGLVDSTQTTRDVRTQPNTDAVPSGNQPPGVMAPGSSFSCESMLSELRTAGPNELSYQKELFEQRFNRARQLCYKLLDNPRSSVAHYETLKRLNELIYACVSYSDFFKSRLGNVPNRDINKSLLDKHDQEVQEIQNLKTLIQNVCNNTDGQDASGLPTPDQTTTFVRNVQAGMVVRYERAKTQKQSTPTRAGTPAGGKK